RLRFYELVPVVAGVLATPKLCGGGAPAQFALLQPRAIRTFLRLRISTAPNSSAFCYAFLLESCFAPRTREGRLSARGTTQASSPQTRHLPRRHCLWTHL